MPSVAEELAALRARSITKSHASKLQDANGLSTPEQEAEALKASNKKTRVSAYSKEAAQFLNAGSKAVDQDLDFKVQQIAKKKEDKQKQREAAQTNNAGTKAVDKHLDFQVQKMAQKRESFLKTKEAMETNKAGTKAVDKNLDFQVQQIGQKKEHHEKKKEASQFNNAGTKAVDKQLDFQVQKIAQKKEDKEKQKEASQNLQSFNEAKRVAGETKKAIEQPAPESAATPAENPTPPKPEATQPAETAPTPTPSPVVENTSAPAPPTAPEPASASAPAPAPAVVDDVPEIEDVPELEAPTDIPEPVPEPVPQPVPQPVEAPGPRVQNRAEKKARKMMQKLGLKPVPGISRVTLKMGGRQGFFTIHAPDVFQKNGSYVIFGEARQGAGSQQIREQQAQAVQQLSTPAVPEPKVEPVVDEPTGAIDETGVESKDIDLVMSQAGCSRGQAVKALKENDGDLVNAIMAITN